MSNTVRTLGEIARFFNVSRDTVRKNWVARGMPGERGCWNLSEIEEWRESTFRTTPAHTRGGDDYFDEDGETPASEEAVLAKREKLIADARRAKAEAELKELKVRELTDNLVHLADVERTLAEILDSFRGVLDQVCDEMEPIFPESDRERLVEELRERHKLVLQKDTGQLGELVAVKQ